LPFVLCDTMGLEEQSGAGLDIDDISSILQGHVPDRYKVSAWVHVSGLGNLYSGVKCLFKFYYLQFSSTPWHHFNRMRKSLPDLHLCRRRSTVWCM